MTHKLMLPAALILMLSAVSAQAAYNDWDANADAGIDRNEYTAQLDDKGMFNTWDKNGDSVLSKQEFTAGLGDKSADFNDRFGADAWSNWDSNADDRLSPDELYGGTFTAYDADRDNIIEEPEYGDLGDDVGDGGFWDV